MGIRPGSATLNTRLMVRLGAAVRVPGECGPPVQPPPTSRAYDRPGHSHTWLQGKFCGHRFVQPCSVVEPFHFGPAPASQDGGSGFSFSSSSSSSSSPVVNNLLLNKKFLQIHVSIYWGLFYSKKGTTALLCSSSTVFKEIPVL